MPYLKFYNKHRKNMIMRLTDEERVFLTICISQWDYWFDCKVEIKNGTLVESYSAAHD
eukprot:TRINITY_DN9191_c0_g1_i1.p1 TRINITY_DN9191_c0_g1~~TRINITY_DN9191_c0_g1_i1.p1  ORF type:complete len:58 (-),score=3.80 TRINITY_DN9191_c0_g1_i1:73-246(-)